MAEGTSKSGIGKRSALRYLLAFMAFLLVLFLWQILNPSSDSTPASMWEGSAVRDFYSQIQTRWNKSFMELPAEELIIITPHNDRIREKFEDAFVKYSALQNGKRILIWWQDVEGSNALMDQLLTGPQGRDHRIDVVFGGGVYLFRKLEEAGLLRPLTLPEDVRQAIPSEFGGLKMMDPAGFWCGNVLSGFGFLYNKTLLRQAGLQELTAWQDLGRPELFDQVELADPAVSGSAVMAFEMVLQSASDWPSGWADLLSILSNAKEFTSGSDDAANGPLFGRAAAAVCIDFYGTSRAALHPDTLEYVSPIGQTAFTPDPIAILQDAPNPRTAEAFVNFVLSDEGQKLWGLPWDTRIPALNSPYRNPIRMDFYTEPGSKKPAGMINPYQPGATLKIDPHLRDARYGVLVALVKAAAIDNFEAMKAARAKLIETGIDSQRLAEFNKLPEDIDTMDEIYSVSRDLQSPARKEQIVSAWTRFFADQYNRVSQ